MIAYIERERDTIYVHVSGQLPSLKDICNKYIKIVWTICCIYFENSMAEGGGP
jgi:hypothetical protein